MPDKKTYPHACHRQRVRDIFRKSNIDELPDRALLEMLLFYSIPRRDTNSLAGELLGKYGSLEGVFNASYDDLLAFDGLGESSALLLTSMPAFSRRYGGKSAQSPSYLSKEDIFSLVSQIFEEKEAECFIMLCFDPAGRLLCSNILAQGDKASVTVDKKSILKLAFECEADSVIFAHNHPNGDAAPSASDIELTAEAARLLAETGIRLTDHLIYGSGDLLSLASLSKFRELFP